MSVDVYQTVVQGGQGIYTEKRSKFLAFAHHVETEEEVKTLLQTYRKKYFDARHVCYAYYLGADAAVTRANDDGEPSGSAGRPIQGQLQSFGVTDTLVVVVRYYGGVNLGTGGLVVAYKTAAAAALEDSVIEERTVCGNFLVTAPYEDVDVTLRRIKGAGGEVVQRTYDATATTLTVSIRVGEKDALMEQLRKIHTLTVKDFKE